VTDGSGATDGAVLTIGVSGGAAALTIGPAVLPAATVGQSYSHQLITTGGTSPYHYSLASGSSLPTGLALSSSGLISGSPKVAGNTKVTVKVGDANGDSGTSALALSVASASSTKRATGSSSQGTGSASTTASSSSTSTTEGTNEPVVKRDPRLKIVREGAPAARQVHSSSGSIVPVIVGIALGAVLLGTAGGVATRRRRRLSEEDLGV
jgi:hypothetical protein